MRRDQHHSDVVLEVRRRSHRDDDVQTCQQRARDHLCAPRAKRNQDLLQRRRSNRSRRSRARRRRSTRWRLRTRKNRGRSRVPRKKQRALAKVPIWFSSSGSPESCCWDWVLACFLIWVSSMSSRNFPVPIPTLIPIPMPCGARDPIHKSRFRQSGSQGSQDHRSAQTRPHRGSRQGQGSHEKRQAMAEQEKLVAGQLARSATGRDGGEELALLLDHTNEVNQVAFGRIVNSLPRPARMASSKSGICEPQQSDTIFLGTVNTPEGSHSLPMAEHLQPAPMARSDYGTCRRASPARSWWAWLARWGRRPLLSPQMASGCTLRGGNCSAGTSIRAWRHSLSRLKT